jgi:hypothetical protein
MRNVDGPLEHLVGLDEHVARWVADGVISHAQAEQIVAEEQVVAPEPVARRTTLVTEALGYVGGVLVVVASLLLTARFWPDLAVGVRLALAGVATVLLLGVGAALPAEPGKAGERLRSVAWLLSTGTLAFLLGLLAVEVLGWRDESAALFISSGAAVYAGALWVRAHLLLQQAAVFVTLASAAAAALAKVAPSGAKGDGLPGLGILAVGLVWLLLGAWGALHPRRLVLMLGGVGAVIGAAVAEGTDWGRVVALVTVFGLVALALRVDEIALLAVGTLGMFIVLPPVLTTWFPGAVAAPLVLLVCGALLVLVALRALRDKDHPARHPRGTRTRGHQDRAR